MNPTITIDQLPTYAEISMLIFKEICKRNINDAFDLKEKIADLIKQNFNLSDEHMNIENSKGNNVINLRVSWAKSYLTILNLVEKQKNLKNKEYVLTSLGKQYSNSLTLDIFKKLVQDYRTSMIKTKNNNLLNNTESKNVLLMDKNDSKNKLDNEFLDNNDYSPLEQLDQFSKNYLSQIKDELYRRVMELNPYSFEKLIRKLLLNMGYKKITVTQKSRDGGIDGIISTDVLGFNDILYQVKRYKEDFGIGISQINEFIGAIDKKTNHGLFFTTSYFTSDAIKKSHDASKNIQLIAKDELLNLMIKFNVGVKDYNIEFPIKEINDQFFEEIDNN